jgi:hypothetical protein
VGLRAENQLLKRYLTYFENLFAKKAEAPPQRKCDADIEAKPQEPEVSFVLERAQGESSASKLGLFSIALVMCVCCLLLPASSPAQASSQAPTPTVSGQALLTVEEPIAAQPDLTMLQAAGMLLFTWTSLLKIVFLLFFAMMILTFPFGDEFKQWAARRPLLRKLF